MSKNNKGGMTVKAVNAHTYGSKNYFAGSEDSDYRHGSDAEGKRKLRRKIKRVERQQWKREARDY